MQETFQTGATSKTVELAAFNISDGSPNESLAYTDVTYDYAYCGPFAAVGAVATQSLALVTTAWTSAGFIKKLKNKYRFDIPNAVIAGGSGKYGSTLQLIATGVYFEPCDIKLTNFDPIVANDLLTPVNAIKAKTDSLTFTVSNVVDSGVTTASVTAIVAGVFGHLIERGLTFDNAIRLIGALVAGKTSGGGTVTEVFHGLRNDGTPGIVRATMVNNGSDRTAFTFVFTDD